MKFERDTSTINRAAFEALTHYDMRERPYYKLGTEGMGCFLDPPGFPSYFLQPIYNSAGNTPDNAPDSVITLDGVSRIVMGSWKAGDTWESRSARFKTRMRRLYAPLPIEHPRVQAWIGVLFGYFNNCYVDMRLPEAIRRNVDKLYMPNRQMLDFANHDEHLIPRALLDVQEFYPDYAPVDMPTGGYGSIGDWWERHTTRPTVAECPGPFFGPHTNTGRCQFCGSTDGVQL